MSAICHNFVQNAWKKDLCSNCFKSSSEHRLASAGGISSDGGGGETTNSKNILNFINGDVSCPAITGSNGEVKGRYKSQATTIYQTRSLLTNQSRAWPSLVVDQKIGAKGHTLNTVSTKLPATCMTETSIAKDEVNDCGKTGDANENEGESINSDSQDCGEKSKKGDEDGNEEVMESIDDDKPADFKSEKMEAKPSVKFYEQVAQVIGYGGNDYDPDELGWQPGSDDEDEWNVDLMDDTTEERIITRVTKENTEFNSNNNNLLKDPVEENHVMNVKNAISKLEGLSNGASSKRAPVGTNDEKTELRAKNNCPQTSKLEKDTSSSPKEAGSCEKDVKTRGTEDVGEKSLEKRVEKELPNQEAIDQKKCDDTKCQPIYSVVSKRPKSVESQQMASQCTCPIVEIQKQADQWDDGNDVNEPHYKVPIENNKKVVPESQVAEFLNYDVPAGTSNPVNVATPKSDNIEEDKTSQYYDVIPSVRSSNDVDSNDRSTSPVLPPPDLPSTQPPPSTAATEQMTKCEKVTSEQIAAVIGIAPKPQCSFLHNISSSIAGEEVASVPSKDSLEDDNKSWEEENVTANPIYTPTETLEDGAENPVGTPDNSDCTLDSSAKAKYSVENLSSSKSDVDENLYDAVESQDVANGSSSDGSDIYQDIATPQLDNSVNFDELKGEDTEVMKQRNCMSVGNSKRQAPLPPKSSLHACGEEQKKSSISKKEHRHSMNLSSDDTNGQMASAKTHVQVKSKSNSLGNFQKLRLCPSSIQMMNREEKTPSKQRKGKFWKKILNRFSRDEEELNALSDEADDKSNWRSTDSASLSSSSLSATVQKKPKLEIIHPIDFEQSGGPQIIESPAITITESGLPSVVDCSSPASSICSGMGPRISMDDAAISSDSGGNYESVGEDEDSSSGHNGYVSHDEQSSDYFEASNSDCSTGDMAPTQCGKTKKPAPPSRSKVTEIKSTNQAPARPPPPKVIQSSKVAKNEVQNRHQFNRSDITAPDYVNARDLAEESEESHDEVKRKKAPAPPNKDLKNVEEYLMDHTYQNLNELNSSSNESDYYETLEMVSSKSKALNEVNNQQNSCLHANDNKSTDSGFIDCNKSSKAQKIINSPENQDFNNLYEKVDSGGSTRSSSPNYPEEDHRVNRRRNCSGFSDSSFKMSGRKLASLTLEENYGNIVCHNHETLAFILENVQRVKTSHPISEKSSSLKWQDFVLQSAEPIVSYKKSRTVLTAHNKSYTDLPLTLMVSKDGHCLSPQGNAPFIIHPIAQFKDLVPASLFSPDAPEQKSAHLTVSSSVWVLDYINAKPICTLAKKNDGLDDNQIYFIMLQLITALKFLQAHGIEELDGDLDNFLIDVTNNHLYIFGDPSLQNVREKESEFKLSLCHAAIAYMIYLLKGSDYANFSDITEETLKILDDIGHREVRPIADILMKEKAVSLSQAKSLLEYLLWGPPPSSLDRQEFCTPNELETAIQRWLDQERACFLSNLIRGNNCRNVQSLVLSTYDEYKLIFLVRTSVKIIREASVMLEPEMTTF